MFHLREFFSPEADDRINGQKTPLLQPEKEKKYTDVGGFCVAG